MQGPIAWFARNGVVANLLMFVIIVGGFFSVVDIKKEIFPEFSVDIIRVSVEYRGAAPEEVEEGVNVRIEEAVQDVDGIKEIRSTAYEGQGTVLIEVRPGYDSRELLNDVKSRVDGIDTFPVETEKPVIEEVTNRFQVINVSIAGDADEWTLKRLGEEVRDELLLLPEISQVELQQARPYEISIEVSEDTLRRYGLTFDEVANAVRRFSLDLPGGAVKTDTEEILLRTEGQAYHGEEFERLTLRTQPDGSKLRLADVATVIDGFEETEKFARLDGKPTVLVQVFRVGEENALDVAAAVHDYVAKKQPELPDGLTITTWADGSRVLLSRMDLLIRNAVSGLALVFLVLALFLRLRLAFWVSLGIPISFLGALALLPMLDVSINMISLFSFILVLGIVVDDAIVVGESIFSEQQRTHRGLKAAIDGTRAVAVPVIFGVLTTVAAFAPMLFVSGTMGRIWRVIPCVVISALLFSLVESKLVLPYHLSHYRPQKPRRRNIIARCWNGFFDFFANGLQWFIHTLYRPALRLALKFRYATVAIAIMTLLLTVGLVGGGIVKFVFFPQVESDNVVVNLTMPQETPVHVTAGAIARIERAAFQLDEEIQRQYGYSVFRHILTTVGEQPFRVQANRNSGNAAANFSQPHLGEVNIELIPSEERDITSSELVNRWRELAPEIPDAVELTFTSDLFGGEKAIDIQVSGKDLDTLRSAVTEIKSELAGYPGVIDITDTFRGGKPELELSITSEAEAMGLTLQDLGRQVRQGFFGEEAQRIQRGRDDVRVMVRYPRSERDSLGDLENMRIRTPDGAEVPFSTVARAELDRGFASITRVDRQRTINVQAEVDEAVTNANEVLAKLDAEFLPGLLERYPGISYSFEGEQREQMETMSDLLRGFVIAMFVIYALIAIPFGSYFQPLIVMSAVPFGIVGAVWGHLIMGMDMSILSMCGVVALAGVVVNASLVLVSFINSHREDGLERMDAVLEASVARFRPILLTALTTAAGVTPLMLERSVQARFLIPMAVALAYGVLFATAITLALVPSLYLILDDIKRLLRWIYRGPAPEPVPAQEKLPPLQPVTSEMDGRLEPVSLSSDGDSNGRRKQREWESEEIGAD